MKKNFIGFAGLMVVLAMTFVACSSSSEPGESGSGVHTVTFDKNTDETAVTGMPTPNPRSVEHGQRVIKPTTTPIRLGYDFVDWYKDQAGTTAWNFRVDTVTESATLWAKWDAVSPHVVTFEKNTGDVVTNMPTAEDYEAVVHNSKLTEPGTPVRDTGEDYVFDGWFDNEDLDGDAWDFDTDTVTTSITLYANWYELQMVDVFFEKNTEDPDTIVTDMPTVLSAKERSKIAEPASEPARVDGFVFDGWYKDEDGLEAWDFNVDTVPRGGTTLYAKWAYPTVSITGIVKEHLGNDTTTGDPIVGTGDPIAGVTVTISGGNLASPKTATTNAAGEYTLDEVPYGTDYTVEASKAGYASRTKIKYTVDASTTGVDFLIAEPTGTEFDDKTGWISKGSGQGTYDIITSGNDTFARIVRTPASGNWYITNENAVLGGTAGKFTIEVRMRRNVAENQFFMWTYSALQAGWSGTTAATINFTGTSLATHHGASASDRNARTVMNNIAANTWYTIALYVDADAQTHEFWVDGVKRSWNNSGTIVDTFKFRDVMTGGISFYHFGWDDGPATNNGDIDYIRVYPYNRWEE